MQYTRAARNDQQAVRPTLAICKLQCLLRSIVWRACLKAFRAALAKHEVVHVEAASKTGARSGRPISGVPRSGREMLERQFVDGSSVQEYIRKKVEQHP